ncbi:unnamed protein product [Calicophoron daubneyi]|uniref:EF-hand domain-containing protein n=1 Tax=Calicophoron daubneyi TaxID=300641 RepID=A0AAV2TV08_CALDB
MKASSISSGRKPKWNIPIGDIRSEITLCIDQLEGQLHEYVTPEQMEEVRMAKEFRCSLDETGSKAERTLTVLHGLVFEIQQICSQSTTKGSQESKSSFFEFFIRQKQPNVRRRSDGDNWQSRTEKTDKRLSQRSPSFVADKIFSALNIWKPEPRNSLVQTNKLNSDFDSEGFISYIQFCEDFRERAIYKLWHDLHRIDKTAHVPEWLRQSTEAHTYGIICRHRKAMKILTNF